MTAMDSDVATSAFVNLHAVNEIEGNAWQYGVSQPSGALAFGLGSQWVSSLEDTTTGLAQWSIQVGNVAN